MPHCQELIGAIKARGLGHLIARTKDQAATSIRGALEESVDPDDWDPLAQAAIVIYRSAYRCAGEAVLLANAEGGHRCPICYGAVVDPQVAQWIAVVADACLDYARQHDLVMTASHRLQ